MLLFITRLVDLLFREIGPLRMSPCWPACVLHSGFKTVKPARNKFTSVCFNVISRVTQSHFQIFSKGKSFMPKTCQTLADISMIFVWYVNFSQIFKLHFWRGFAMLVCMCAATVACCNQPGAWNNVVKVLEFFSHTVSN